MASTTTTPPPPSSSDHIVITVGVTINVPTSIAGAQQTPPTVVWTGPTGQDASVQTQDASVDEAQQAAAPALHSQPMPNTSQETVPRPEIEEEAGAEDEDASVDEAQQAAAPALHSQPAPNTSQETVPRPEIEEEAEEEAGAEDEPEAEAEDRAPEANVDCFTNLKRSHWLRAAVLGAINGLFAPASMILDNSFPLNKDNIFAKENLPYFTGIISGAATMAMGEYVSIRSQLDVQQRSGLEERGSPNPWIAGIFSFAAYILGALLTTAPFCYLLVYLVYPAMVPAFVIVVSFWSVLLGWLGAKLGRTPVYRSIIRYVVGGWFVIAITVSYVMTLYFLGVFGS